MPQPAKKMAVGFNHNVQYKGHVYHVQTEDSGVDNPHVITHLFVGGNILASKKTAYSHLLGRPDLEVALRELMEKQHKGMLRELVAGQFDGQEQGGAARAFQPGELADAAKAKPAAPKVAAKPAPPPVAPEAPSETLFAEDLLSEKSLDEVILGYLSGQIDE